MNFIEAVVGMFILCAAAKSAGKFNVSWKAIAFIALAFGIIGLFL